MVGTALGRRGPAASGKKLRRACPVLAIVLSLAASTVSAGERYAVIITGASGGAPYAQKYLKLREAMATTLRNAFDYKPDHIVVLAETEKGESERVLKATRENVQRAFAALQKRLTKDDQLLVLLIGHGTLADGARAPQGPEGSVGDDGKFNLVGPGRWGSRGDINLVGPALSATEGSEVLKPQPGRLVFVDTTAASFPFLHKLARRGRVVLTATDSAAQQFETVFPEFFIKAFGDASADVDKSGRVSIWEAFVYASAAVRQYFEQKGELPTERALLDDTGGGLGREAQAPGVDGALARITYLEPEPALELPSDAGLAVLVKRRAALEAALEELKARRESLSPEQYAAELERILTELARVSLQIKAKS